MSFSDFAFMRRGSPENLAGRAEAKSVLPRLAGAIGRHIGALVYPDAQNQPAALLQHKIFIASRLMMALAALMLLPAFLTFDEVSLPWQIAAFSWASLPILAVFLLSRTGRLFAAQLLCALCLGLMAVVFVQSGRPGAAISTLLLVPVEIAFSADLLSIIVASVCMMICAVLILLAQKHGWLVRQSGENAITSAAVMVPGAIYAISLGYLFYAMLQISHRATLEGASRFESLSEAVGDLVLRHSADGAVVSSSAASVSLFNIEAGELEGRGFFDRLNVADRPAYLKAITQALASDETVSTQLRLRTGRMEAMESGPFSRRLRFDGETSIVNRVETAPVYVDVELRARRLLHFKSDGVTPASSIMSIVRDISAARRHEAELQAARVHAEQVNLWKDRLLANVSHELRTPLNAIIGFADMLSDETLAPKSHAKRSEYAGIIATSGHHLLAVVNSILDVSKIEAGSFHLNPEPFELAELLDSCTHMFSLKAREAQVLLVRDFSVASHDEIVADKRACKQIIINLLSNAVKFTPAKGTVTLSMQPLGNSLCIRVSDTGIGMNGDDLARIGEPFFQAAANYDRAFEGTGLGLSLVRGLVGLHGGDIRIDSELGRGTKVTVRLPLDCRYTDKEPNAAPAILTGALPVSDVVDAATFQLARMMKSA